MALTTLTNLSAGAPGMYSGAGRLIAVLDYCLVTNLGWSKVYSGTNLAVYRAPTGNRRYLRVNDANASDAVLRGYEAMTAVSTGTGAFPTTAQVALASGPYMLKNWNGVGSGSPTPWRFLGGPTFFHLFIDVDPPAYPFNFSHFAFGDFPSYIAGDAYNTILIGNALTGTFTASGQPNICALEGMYTGALSYVPRAAAQTGTAQPIGKCADGNFIPNASAMSGILAYPVQGPGGLYMSPLFLAESAAGVAKGLRGVIPGVWATAHSAGTFTEGDTFSGTGALAGKSFLWRAGNTTSQGIVIETSDTWAV